MKYVIPDVPHLKGFAKLVDKLLAKGATLPDVEPIPEATAEVFGRLAREEFDKPLPPKGEWTDRVTVNHPRGPTFGKTDVMFMEIVEGLGNVQNMSYKTGLCEERCEEIFKVRDELLDIT